MTTNPLLKNHLLTKAQKDKILANLKYTYSKLVSECLPENKISVSKNIDAYHMDFSNPYFSKNKTQGGTHFILKLDNFILLTFVVSFNKNQDNSYFNFFLQSEIRTIQEDFQESCTASKHELLEAVVTDLDEFLLSENGLMSVYKLHKDLVELICEFRKNIGRKLTEVTMINDYFQDLAL